jgi:hypothetical protein
MFAWIWSNQKIIWVSLFPLITGLYTFFPDLFKQFGLYLVGEFKFFFFEFYQFAWHEVTVLISENLVDNVSVNGVVELSDNFYSTANYFFPLNEFGAIVTVVFLYAVTVWGIRIILKSIPTIW